MPLVPSPEDRPAPEADARDPRRSLPQRVFGFLRRHASNVAFVGGFVYDAITLRRIDRLLDNVLLALYLLALGVLLVLERRRAWLRPLPRVIVDHPRVLDFLTQFLFGGLLSAYVVFYFKSAGAFRSFAFLGLLAVLLTLNEYRDGALRRVDSLRLGLYFFVAFSFFQFFLPVMTGVLHPLMTVASTACALVLGLGVVLAAHFDGPGPDAPRAVGGPRLGERLGRQGAVMLGLAGLLVGLAQAGVIPPVPVSVTSRRVAHSLERTGDGYVLTVERQDVLELLRLKTQRLGWTPGEAMVVFTAVFVPRGSALEVAHRWEHRDDGGSWQQTDLIPFSVLGGRDGGFRGYTRKQNLSPGDWRVTVETPDGRPVGSVRFNLVEGVVPVLRQEIL